MAKQYVYKIQWLFNARPKNMADSCYPVIKALGAKSLTIIHFRDENMKIVGNYHSMNMYPFGLADAECIKAIKAEIKKNDRIMFVELLRK